MPASRQTQSLRSPTPDAVIVVALVLCLTALLGTAFGASGNSGTASAVRVAALPDRSVGQLELVRHNDGVLIHVPAPPDVAYETMALANPDRFIVDFRDAVLAPGQPPVLPVAYAGVREVRATQQPGPPPQVRVVLLLDAAVPCGVRSARGGSGLTILAGNPRASGAGLLADRAPMAGPMMASPAELLTPDFWRMFLAAARGAPLNAKAAPARHADGPAPAEAASGSALASDTSAGERADSRPAAHEGLARPTGGLRLPERTVTVAPAPAPRRASAPVRLAAAIPVPLAGVTPSAPQAGEAEATHTLRGLGQMPSSSGFQLALNVTGRVDFETLRRRDPLRYVLKLPDTALASNCPTSLDVNDPLVQSVAASTEGGTTQVTIFLKERASCSSYQAADGGRIVALIRSVPTLNPDALAAAQEAAHRAAERKGAAPSTMAAAAPAEVPAAASAAEGGEVGPGGEGEGLIDIHFYNADITEILSALARYSNKNIVASSSVTGILTVSLSQVTLEDALDLITKLQGFDWVLRGTNTYVVGTPEELAKIEPPTPTVKVPTLEYTYTARNVTADDITAYFDALKPVKETDIVKVPNTSTVIFVNIPDAETESWIRDNLQRMDVPKPPLTVIQQLKNISAEQAQEALGRLVPDVKVTTAPPAAGVQVLQITGPQAAVTQAEDVLKMVDIPASQQWKPPAELVSEYRTVDYVSPMEVQNAVSSAFESGVEVIPITGLPASGGAGVEEVGSSEIKDVGGLKSGGLLLIRGDRETVDAVLDFIAKMDVAPIQVELKTTITELGLDSETDVGFAWELPALNFRETSVSNGWHFGTFERDAMDFLGTLTATLSRKRSKILATPKIVTLNKKTGSLLVGSIIPYEVSVPGEGTVTRSVQFQQVGLGVKFTPLVNSDGTITIYLSPQVSTFTGFTPNGYPEVSTREAKTILRVRDGDIIVMGGLLQDQDLITKSGIPFLRDFPIIGELFSERNKSRTKTEIVIVAEVRVLPQPGSPATAEAGAPGPG